MAKSSELRDLDDDELDIRGVETRQELFNLRFQHVTGQLDNYARLGQVRRDVARIATLQTERAARAAEATPAQTGSADDEEMTSRG